MATDIAQLLPAAWGASPHTFLGVGKLLLVSSGLSYRAGGAHLPPPSPTYELPRNLSGSLVFNSFNGISQRSQEPWGGGAVSGPQTSPCVFYRAGILVMLRPGDSSDIYCSELSPGWPLNMEPRLHKWRTQGGWPTPAVASGSVWSSFPYFYSLPNSSPSLPNLSPL